MPPVRLLDQVRSAARLQHLSLRTEQAYVSWVRRFIRFHGTRHPRELGADDVRSFLSHLACDRNVAASTQNQALSALLFLYRAVLGQPLPRIDGLQPARKPSRLPSVLNRDEVRAVLGELHGSVGLIGALLYGAGLRLLEALRLRIKDIDLELHTITSAAERGRRTGSPSCRTP